MVVAGFSLRCVAYGLLSVPLTDFCPFHLRTSVRSTQPNPAQRGTAPIPVDCAKGLSFWVWFRLAVLYP